MARLDLDSQTLRQTIDWDHPRTNHGSYQQAVDTLIAWQLASQPGVLAPEFDSLSK